MKAALLMSAVLIASFCCVRAQSAADSQQPERLNYLIVAASSVQDSNRAITGNLEAVALDPRSQQIQFALISLGYPSNRTVVSPIPWQMLQFQSDARASGGIPGTFQRFTVPMNAATLLRAPRIDWAIAARMNDTKWITASMGYFGAVSQVPNVGSAPSGSGVTTGGDSSPGAATTNDVAAAEAPTYQPGAPGYDAPLPGNTDPGSLQEYLALGTNVFGPDFLTNVLGTNTSLATTTNLAATTNSVLSSNLLSAVTNFFATNFFARTNRATTTNFPQMTQYGSNLIQRGVFGSNLTPRFSGSAPSTSGTVSGGASGNGSTSATARSTASGTAPSGNSVPATTGTSQTGSSSGLPIGTTPGTQLPPQPTPAPTPNQQTFPPNDDGTTRPQPPVAPAAPVAPGRP